MCKLQLHLPYGVMSNKISHSGVVDSIADGVVKVRILQTSACAACKVAGMCHASESKEKMIDVRCDDASAYAKGQSVVVTASPQIAARATLLGFGIPLLILVMVLITVLGVTGNEGAAALLALVALAPYYIVLWLLRERMGRSVSFQIEELKN